MRIGGDGIEGSVEEIRGIFEIHGESLRDYLKKPEPPLKRAWVIAPAVTGIIAIISLVLIPLEFEKARMMVTLVPGLGSAGWLAGSAHLRFKSAWITGISGGVLALLVLTAVGVIPLAHLLDVVKGFLPSQKG